MQLEDVPLLPRSKLFGNPARGGCQVSPDGRWLGFVAPFNGIMNVWVCELGAPLDSARRITEDRNRGIYSFNWAYDGVHILYQQDENGDENSHVFAVPAAGGGTRDLTPFRGARALLQGLSRKHPGTALVGINRRDARFPDLFRLDMATGSLALVRENPGFLAFVTDDDFNVRLAFAPHANGGRVLLKPSGDEWVPWKHVSALDSANTFPHNIHADGCTLYMLDSTGRDTAALVSYDLDSGSDTGTVIGEHRHADVTGVWLHIDTHAPLAWSATYERREIHVVDESIRKDVEFLDVQMLGEWSVGSRTADDQIWIISASSDTSPASFYSYDRRAQKLAKLYEARPELAGAPLARMQHTTIKSRDGLDLVVYLSLPVHADRREEPLKSNELLPLVLHVHGGPQARDSWGYDAQHQWLANRGYAVMSVNFRASTGFGKSFIAAGDGQWGARMDDDLVDAVTWAVGRGIADPARICVMGGSYGGYATLWSMTAHPQLYACGVDIVGPSNLETLAASVPPYWEAAKSQLFRMIGDESTEAGRALMKERSPVHRAGLIRKPLLIGQGANDPRVKQAESDQMAAAMKANGVPVTYVLFPDEGHGFHRPPNNIRFNAITELFLSKYLGGRFEPITPGEVDGNTAVLVEDSID
jgi:dipeptidyl aminopeptidase/acylaminoacyl peptidase